MKIVLQRIEWPKLLIIFLCHNAVSEKHLSLFNKTLFFFYSLLINKHKREKKKERRNNFLL